MAKLFNIKNGKAYPTKEASMIYYLKDIIEEFGEEISGKIFYYFNCLYDLNKETNPFADLPENKKEETIIRSCFIEAGLTIDLSNPLIVNALDLVQELYESPSYRVYKGMKNILDKMAIALEFSYVDTSKSDGNSGELKKLIETYDIYNEKSKKAYTDLLDENNSVINRGNRKSSGYEGIGLNLE